MFCRCCAFPINLHFLHLVRRAPSLISKLFNFHPFDNFPHCRTAARCANVHGLSKLINSDFKILYTWVNWYTMFSKNQGSAYFSGSKLKAWQLQTKTQSFPQKLRKWQSDICLEFLLYFSKKGGSSRCWANLWFPVDLEIVYLGLGNPTRPKSLPTRKLDQRTSMDPRLKVAKAIVVRVRPIGRPLAPL